MSGANKANEIYLTRVYDAPVKLVWAAWTDPARAAHWWGPRGFTITTHSKDLRPGGHWSYTMHGPDGTDYVNKAIYFEVEECARLVYDHGGSDDRPPLFRVTVTFEELPATAGAAARTKMSMTMALATAEAAAETKKFIKSAGGEGTWDRLAEYLAEQGSGEDLFVLQRSFDAPIETLFQMWTDPVHMARWLAPAGSTMRFVRGGVRVGETSLTAVSGGPPGAEVTMYDRVTYLEITPASRLVYTQQFADADGNVTRHPLSALWPETMRTTIELAPEGEHRTRLRLTWQPAPPTTPEERATFLAARGNMAEGWTGSLDQLEAAV